MTQENDIIKAAQALYRILYAAKLHDLPLPFAASSYDYTQTISLTFKSREEVHTWTNRLEIDEVEETEGSITTRFEWLGVSLRLSAV